MDNSLKRMCWVQQSITHGKKPPQLQIPDIWNLLGDWPETPGGQKFCLRPHLVLRNWFIRLGGIFWSEWIHLSVLYNKSCFHSCPELWGFTPSLAHSLKIYLQSICFCGRHCFIHLRLDNKIGIILDFVEHTNHIRKNNKVKWEDGDERLF